ncbi:MAG: tRNA (N6-threonylcarbamoyladenosine(37)-N6)-methyltransferase TrmO [Oscillospiraceae bacterium]|jgi:tRNA-Thr(GGU) m(6)t(6)A37 methyltransferase TsaA|nr:tRNA (N6-threonylcarbamoyladenosine(37)-N6)-methyltransferase TrmO [Oscillospiraceae bacterium]
MPSDECYTIVPIAHIETDLPTKFGIPRQSGLVPGLEGRIVFLPRYRDPVAFRGLEGYSHLWLIWGFSENKRDTWASTVKPPRLGGNKRMGVFATRSPYRPNALGLSSVRLERLELDEKLGPVLYVTGADLMNGTPIYDVKPYLPSSDSHPDAVGGFADDFVDYGLEVVFPEPWLSMIPVAKQEALFGILRQDPRPSYQDDPERVYGFNYLHFDVRFRVQDGVITVCEIEDLR